MVSGPPQPLIEDSLVLLDYLDAVRTIVDVGSGGGMPGLPLKLARPDLQVVLLEADRRKAAFLLQAAARLGVAVEVVIERAETAGRGPLRESFDAACSRALAPMPTLVELCLPLVRVDGQLLAMKTDADAEVEAARAAIRRLGGGAPTIHAAPSPARQLGVVVVVPKVAPTPPAYPRRPGIPNKRPLRA